MVIIGIAGVTIPGAVDCIQKINQLSSLYFPSNEHPHLILDQPNFGPMQSALQRGDWDGVLEALEKSVEFLAQSGADFVIIPANSVHKVIDRLHSSIPVLNMLEIVAEGCVERKIRKIGILGTVWTMSGHLYREELEKRGIEEVIPSPEEQQIIHEAIFKELIPKGHVSPETLRRLLELVASLKRQGCDGIALVCTELPLALDEANCGMPVIDSTQSLAKAALKRCAGCILDQG